MFKSNAVLAFAIVALAVLLGISIVNFSNQNIDCCYTIETVSTACMIEDNDIDIRAQNNSIIITAPMQTPTPCYSAIGNVNVDGKKIEVTLSTIPNNTACVQCIGEIVGKVVITNLQKGNYGLQVSTPGKAAITTIMIE